MLWPSSRFACSAQPASQPGCRHPTPQGRVHFVKPSERRKQEASMAAKRFKQQEFK